MWTHMRSTWGPSGPRKVKMSFASLVGTSRDRTASSGDRARGGRIATVLVGPDVAAGSRDARSIDHYGVLATVEDSLGLPRLAAAKSPVHGSLRALFRRFGPIRGH